MKGIESEWNLFAAVSDSYEFLTEPEREILGLIAEGLSNQEIADRLLVSLTAAKIQVSYILKKLGLRDPAQAVIYAYRHGLVEPPPQA